VHGKPFRKDFEQKEVSLGFQMYRYHRLFRPMILGPSMACRKLKENLITSTEDEHDAIGNLFLGLMYGFEPFNKKRNIIVSKSRLRN